VIFSETRLKGAHLIDPERHEDERGFFARVWCEREFRAHGLETRHAQSNIAYNKTRGTLRGMHYQVGPHAETKLVRCVRGSIYDVIIDLRADSPTFKEWLGVELTAEKRRMLLVPKGFAHGYQTLEDDVEVFYQSSAFYAPEAEAGVRWDDPAFGIAWPNARDPLLSAKDRSWPDYDG
jgi:dTDP-4-dehydrorhamnose 3,5-epimerase